MSEGGFGQRRIFAGGGFWPEWVGLQEGVCRRGFWPEGGFGRRGSLSGGFFFLFPLTTTVATPNINCILVSTL